MAATTAAWQQSIDLTCGTPRLLATGRHSDFEIKCGHHTFHAHKAILSASFDYFDRLCDSGFKEGQTSSVNLEDAPSLVARLITFAYTSTYHTASLNSESSRIEQFATIDDTFAERSDEEVQWVDRAVLHIQMYALADKYGAASLKHQCRQRFLMAYYEDDEYDSKTFPGHSELSPGRVTSEQEMEDAVDRDNRIRKRYGRVEDCFDDGSWKACCFPIELAYSTTPAHDRGLRDIVLDSLWAGLNNLDHDKVIEVPGMRDLISKIPQLSYDLAVNPRTGVDAKCIHCGLEREGNLGWRCKHDKMNTCTELDCLLKFERDSFCWNCSYLGTLKIKA